MKYHTDFVRAGIAVTLIGGGAALDSWVGFALLSDSSPRLIVLHMIAVAVWLLGVMLVLRPRFHPSALSSSPSQPDETQQNLFRAPRALLRGQTITLALLGFGFVLFPGFGTIGGSVALGFATLPLRRNPERDQNEDNEFAELPIAFHEAVNPIRDLAIQPLADVLADPDVRLKHTAIQLLSRHCDRDAVNLLRGLLCDPDPDVRSEASVALFNFENERNAALRNVMTQTEIDPTSDSCQYNLAVLYLSYVRDDLLDEPSARFYQAQAINALETATKLAPGSSLYWGALARERNNVGNVEGATAALKHALELAPHDIEANLLQVEIAFQTRQWDTLATKVPTGAPLRDPLDPLLQQAWALLQWWEDPRKGEEPSSSYSSNTVATRPVAGLSPDTGVAS